MVATTLLSVVGGAHAFTITIDDFNDFVDTGTQSANVVDPVSVTVQDAGLAGVIGGSRELLVEVAGTFPLLVIGGVLPEGILDYMSIGTGRVRVTYDRDGAGLGTLLARCNDAIEVAYIFADDPAQGIGSGPVQVILTLTGGASVSVAQVVTGSEGVLSYPMSAFAGVNLQNLSAISLELDGTDSDSADLALDSIDAVGCEAPAVPSPSVGPVALTVSVVMLAGLGLLALRRRAGR